MATINVWEDTGEVKCKARLVGPKYANAAKVEFAFYRQPGNALAGKVTATINTPLIGEKNAEAKWPAPHVPDDKVSLRFRYKLIVDGVSNDYFPDEVVVWAREIEVTVTPETNTTAPDAGLIFTMDDPPPSRLLALRGAQVNERRADENGKVTFQLPYPSGFSVAVKDPFMEAPAGWTVGVGRKRAVTVKSGFTAAIEWPVAERIGDEDVHRQWVNLDNPEKGRAKPAHGGEVTVKVRPANEARGREGDKVYVRLTYEAKNAARTQRVGEKAPGTVVEIQGVLDDKKRYSFKVRLGPAGGDRVVVAVGGTPGIADVRLVIEGWRKLHYALAAPNFMKASLPAATLLDGAGNNLPAAVTAAVKTILAPVFIEYEARWSKTAGGYPEYQCLPCAYIERRDLGRKVLVRTTKDYNSDDPIEFPTGDDRTVKINLCDLALKMDVAKVDVDVSVTTQPFLYDFMAVHKRYIFLKSLLDGSDAIDVSGWYWEADVTGLDPAADPPHPAFDDQGASQTGPVDLAWFKPNNFKCVEIQFPAGSLPKRLVTPTDGTAPVPVAVRFSATVQTGGVNGSALALRQLMVLKPRSPLSMAATFCHELGHSMGMTITPNMNKPPYGLPAPPHVDSGGDYYRNPRLAGDTVAANGVRSSHNGSHCAAGLPNKALSSFNGLAGTCILFGEGGDDDAKARKAFCATCQKYIKARNLASIATGFSARAPEDC